MSAQGLDVFDKTLQTTHMWLNDISDQLIPDRQFSWRALGAVLHTLRDRLPTDLAAHLSAELPLLIRGLYYDQYRPSAQPSDVRDLGAFFEAIAGRLKNAHPSDPRDATRAVFATLSRRVPAGQIGKVQDALPEDIRAFWRSAEENVVPPPATGGDAEAVRPH